MHVIRDTGQYKLEVKRTDRTELDDTQIWQAYAMLTWVENALRSLKSSLGLKPNFHQNEERADTHLFISVLAYHLLHAIGYQGLCGDHRSWGTIRPPEAHGGIKCQRAIPDGAQSPALVQQRPINGRRQIP